MEKAGTKGDNFSNLDYPPSYGSPGNDSQQYPGGQNYLQPYPGQQPYAGQQPYIVQQQYGGQPYGGQTHMQNTTAVIVTQPGNLTMPHPPDYTFASIFACLCCFWPTGLCAIYYASQAKNAAASGDMEAANRYSNSARNLMITSIVIGVIWIVLVIVLRVVLFASIDSSY